MFLGEIQFIALARFLKTSIIITNNVPDEVPTQAKESVYGTYPGSPLRLLWVPLSAKSPDGNVRLNHLVPVVKAPDNLDSRKKCGADHVQLCQFQIRRKIAPPDVVCSVCRQHYHRECLGIDSPTENIRCGCDLTFPVRPKECV